MFGFIKRLIEERKKRQKLFDDTLSNYHLVNDLRQINLMNKEYGDSEQMEELRNFLDELDIM